MQNNYLYKTLELLEKKHWNEPTSGSYLEKTCFQLRKKQLKDFEIEDLRIMIGQNNSLNYLIPLAIEKLQQNIFAEGDFYEGDLLKSLLTSEPIYWKNNPENWRKLCQIFYKNFEKLKSFDTSKSIKDGWFNAFEIFKNIN